MAINVLADKDKVNDDICGSCSTSFGHLNAMRIMLVRESCPCGLKISSTDSSWQADGTSRKKCIKASMF